MGCCCKKKPQELNIIVQREHLLDPKEINEGKNILSQMYI